MPENPLHEHTVFRPPCETAFSLCKVDAKTGRPLSDAVFELSRGESPLLCGKSDGGGQVRFPALPPGEYSIRETIAPGGYRPLNSPIHIRIKPDGTVLMEGNAVTRREIPNQKDV